MIYNIHIIDFNSFFTDKVERLILDNLYNLNCVENNTINLYQKLTKRIIYINIVQQLLKIISKESTNIDKSIFAIQPNIIIPTIETANYCDIEKFRKIVKKALCKFAKAFPDRIFFLKTFMDLTTIDAINYLFDKSNKYIKNSPDVLLKFLSQENLQIQGY